MAALIRVDHLTHRIFPLIISLICSAPCGALFQFLDAGRILSKEIGMYQKNTHSNNTYINFHIVLLV
jgi:hypothetical protein